MMKELVLKNRSYRRFFEDKKITLEQLKEFIEIGHDTPSAANRQPLRYLLVNEEESRDKVFSCLGWAGYLKDWDGPVKGERPAAYIIMVTKVGDNSTFDEGIVGQTILLAATELGLGGCFIGNVNRVQLAQVLLLDSKLEIKTVIALGYPKEEVVLEEIGLDGDIKYYRDEVQIHHVPKIKVDDLIMN